MKKLTIILSLILMAMSVSAQDHLVRRKPKPVQPTTSRQTTKPKPATKSSQTKPGSQAPLSPVLQNLVNNMVHVSGGTFIMGGTPEQGNDAVDNEMPTHQVTLSPFSIGRYEVTQEEWEAVMGKNPSEFKGAKLPVANVTWNECQTFIRKLRALTGKHFRLPTEAEWEFAARGGNSSLGYKYAGSNDIGSVAWYKDNSNEQPHEVGTKQPNELGLYDMSGNVSEWCQDKYGAYSSAPQKNPHGPSSELYLNIRGGCWRYSPDGCRNSCRSNYDNDGRLHFVGLRLAL